MPRRPRIYIPDMPSHIVQRGNNREPCFFAEQDYRFYLNCLSDACQRYKANVHAYVLMTNHVHLLITPDNQNAISLVMQSIGRRYVQYINKEYRRTGTLWEGRYKASLVDKDNYLLTCMRYIEMNPVRAAMVEHPAQYKWSSFRTNALNEENDLIKPHDLYARLGAEKQKRAEVYYCFFDQEIRKQDMNIIRNSLLFSVPTGDNCFREKIEQNLSRKSEHASRGRPLKKRIGENDY